MKAKLKKVYLENYCGYRELEFDFTKNGNATNLAVLYGPNGSGKSTLLEAINLLGCPHENLARNTNLAFRKLVFHPDYEVDYQGFKPSNTKMTIEGIFETDEGDKRVLIENDGIKVCEIPRKLHGYSYYIDADHPMNMRKFQIENTYLKDFIEMAEIVYGMKCEVSRKVQTEEYISYGDFIINKKYAHEPAVKVHFKSMSDGERKIATLLSYLYDPCYIDDREIILLDNIEMHIYFKRHAKMMDKLISSFPNKQFICTTHSQTLIDHVGSFYGKEHLFDLESMRDKYIGNKSEQELKKMEDDQRKLLKAKESEKKVSSEELGFV